MRQVGYLQGCINLFKLILKKNVWSQLFLNPCLFTLFESGRWSRHSILGISHENFCPRNSSPVFFSVARNISIERFPVRWITCRKDSVCFDCKFTTLTRTVLCRLPNIYFSCHCHTYWLLCCNYWPSVLNTVSPAIEHDSLTRNVYNATDSVINAVSITRIFA